METVNPYEMAPMFMGPTRKINSTKRAKPLSPKEKAVKRKMRRYAQRHNRAAQARHGPGWLLTYMIMSYNYRGW